MPNRIREGSTTPVSAASGTASPDNAVAKFNDLVLDPEAWCDHAVVAVYSLLESGDYDFVGRVTRPLVGREVQAMTEFV